MKQIVEQLDDIGVLIGSKAWGGATDKSDVDYAVLDTDFVQFYKDNHIHITRIDEGNHFSQYDEYGHKLRNIENYKFTIGTDKQVYNVLTYGSEDALHKIECINQFMAAIDKTVIHQMTCENKMYRCMLIENLFDIMWYNDENFDITIAADSTINFDDEIPF